MKKNLKYGIGAVTVALVAAVVVAPYTRLGATKAGGTQRAFMSLHGITSLFSGLTNKGKTADFTSPDDFKKKGGEFKGDASQDMAKMQSCFGDQKTKMEQGQTNYGGSKFSNPGVALYMEGVRQVIQEAPMMVSTAACMIKLMSSGADAGTFTYAMNMPNPSGVTKSMNMSLVLSDVASSDGIAVYGKTPTRKAEWYMTFGTLDTSKDKPVFTWVFGANKDSSGFGIFVQNPMPMEMVKRSVIYKYDTGYETRDVCTAKNIAVPCQVSNLVTNIQNGDTQSFGGTKATGSNFADRFSDVTAYMGKSEANATDSSVKYDADGPQYLEMNVKDAGGARQLIAMGMRNGDADSSGNDAKTYLAFTASAVTETATTTNYSDKKFLSIDLGKPSTAGTGANFDRTKLDRPNISVGTTGNAGVTTGVPAAIVNAVEFRKPTEFVAGANKFTAGATAPSDWVKNDKAFDKGRSWQ